MRVLIYTFGTRGDVQPFLALAQRLVRAGHEAAVCTAAGYRHLVEGAGVDYLHMGNDMLQLIRDTMPQMSGPREAPRLLRAMSSAQRAALADQWTAAREYQPTTVVYHPKSLGGYHIAEKLGVPGVLSLPLPFFTPTKEFPIPFIGHWPFGGRANRLSYQLIRATAVLYGGMLNDFRAELSLPPIRRTETLLSDRSGRPVPVLYGFSRHVCPVPGDYPPSAHVTGYWFLDADEQWQPTDELRRFLAEGPPPIYVGFGSMGFDRGAEERHAAIVEAVRRVGLRAVVASGWSRVEIDSSDDILIIDAAPHDWLLPQVQAVVHHGGSGTTAAGLRAGRPTLVCPVLGDQPFWGHQIKRLGCGPDPLPWRRLTARTLEERLRRLATDTSYRHHADEVARRIRSDDGTGAATEVLESIEESWDGL